MVKKNMSMTISQIKQKLIEHGVPLPPSSSRKEEYERLYVQEVLSQSKSKIVNSGEFSSDDELDNVNENDVIVVDSSVNGIEGINGSDKIDEDDLAVEIDPEILAETGQLTNEEIYTQLIELGQNVGPVVGSTREMYIKKLALVKSRAEAKAGLNGDDAHLNGHHEQDNVAFNGFSSDEDEMTTAPPPRSRSEGRKHSPQLVESTIEDKKERTSKKMPKPLDTYSPVGPLAQSTAGTQHLTQAKPTSEDSSLRKSGSKGKGSGIVSFLKWTFLFVLISLVLAYAYLNRDLLPQVDEIDQAIDEAIKEVSEKSPALDEL